MAQKVFDQKNREFYVEASGRNIYIGTPAMFSDLAAQMIAHEAVADSGMKSNGMCMDIPTGDENGSVIAVGYKVPFFCTTGMALNRVKASIEAYNG